MIGEDFLYLRGKSAFLLTRRTLKIPFRLTSFRPKRSFIWDVNTWTAAAVVKPLTSVSDNREDMTPSRRKYIASCQQWKVLSLYYKAPTRAYVCIPKHLMKYECAILRGACKTRSRNVRKHFCLYWRLK